MKIKYFYHRNILYNLITQAQCWLDKQPRVENVKHID